MLWDGGNPPTPESSVTRTDSGAAANQCAAGEPLAARLKNHGAGINSSLRKFITALRTGAAPMGQIHDNVLSLAMVEAAIGSAAAGQRVRIDDLPQRSYATAVLNERRTDVAEVLRSWAIDGSFTTKVLRGVGQAAA